MSNKLNEGNYELVLKHTIKNFQQSNIDRILQMSNSTYNHDEQYFKIKFLNTFLKVQYPSGKILTESNKIINDTATNILILRFLTNAKGIKETKKYLTYKEVEGGYVYYPNFKSRTIKKFTDSYGKEIEKFKLYMENIGAEKLEIGDISYKVRFINDTYVVFVLWEGDEELEPSGNILFDANISYYFNAEDLAVVPEIILLNLK